LRGFRRQIPLQEPSAKRRLPLRRARDATRTKPSREAVRGSGRSAGEVDESAPGSAKPWSRLVRAQASRRNIVLLVKKHSQTADFAIGSDLTAHEPRRSVPIAPRTERPRLMALRQAVASAAVGWEVGRGSHRLGVLLRGPNFSSESQEKHDSRTLRHIVANGCLTPAKSGSRFPSAPSTERPRLKALPPGSRFGEGRSGELDGGETDSVRFFLPASRIPQERNPALGSPPHGGAHP